MAEKVEKLQIHSLDFGIYQVRMDKSWNPPDPIHTTSVKRDPTTKVILSRFEDLISKGVVRAAIDTYYAVQMNAKRKSHSVPTYCIFRVDGTVEYIPPNIGVPVQKCRWMKGK